MADAQLLCSCCRPRQALPTATAANHHRGLVAAKKRARTIAGARPASTCVDIPRSAFASTPVPALFTGAENIHRVVAHRPAHESRWLCRALPCAAMRCRLRVAEASAKHHWPAAGVRLCQSHHRPHAALDRAEPDRLKYTAAPPTGAPPMSRPADRACLRQPPDSMRPCWSGHPPDASSAARTAHATAARERQHHGCRTAGNRLLQLAISDAACSHQQHDALRRINPLT